MSLWLFAGLSFLAALSPGPAVFVSISLSLQRGLRDGLRGVLGICTGNAVYLLVSALGLTAILTSSGRLFGIVCLIGALYLVWLGAGLLRASFIRSAPLRIPASSSRGSYSQGLTVQLSNPKALLYWGALLPQFVEHGRPVAPQIALLGSMGIGADSVILGGYVVFAAALRSRVMDSGASHWLDRVSGCCFIVAGVLLVATRIHLPAIADTYHWLRTTG